MAGGVLGKTAQQLGQQTVVVRRVGLPIDIGQAGKTGQLVFAAHKPVGQIHHLGVVGVQRRAGQRQEQPNRPGMRGRNQPPPTSG